MPPCPQAHGRAPEALHCGWVPHPHHPPTPPMEHVPSDLPASTPPPASTSSRMALFPLVSGKFTFHVWLTDTRVTTIPSCPASKYCVIVLCSARWHVEEECRPERSSVWSKGSPLLVVPTIWNPQCPRPATPTSALNLRRKVTKLQHDVVLLASFNL